LGSLSSEKQRVKLAKRSLPKSQKSHKQTINKKPKLITKSFGFLHFDAKSLNLLEKITWSNKHKNR
jgi:hypothetical protein